MLQTVWNELDYRVNVCRITYRAPVRYVTKTWSVVLLNKKDIYSYLKCIVFHKLLQPRQSFRITLYNVLSHQVMLEIEQNVFRREVDQYILKSTDLLIQYGIRKKLLNMKEKFFVVNKAEYHVYRPRVRICLTYYCQW